MTKTQFLIPLFLILPIFGCGEKQTNEDETEEKNVNDEENLDPSDYEEGCFIVDGNNSFRWLNDAMLFTENGSSITMNNCDSEHTEQVIINKSITLLGPGADLFTLIAPVNETALTITAPDVVIRDLSIESTRSGLSIETADNVILENLNISETGNFAIKTQASFGVSFFNIDLIANGDGAIQADGGSITADSIYTSENIGTSIHIQGGATFNLTNSTVELTQPSDPNNISDGFGVFVDEGSTFNSEGNLYSSNVLLGIQVVDGAASLTDDEVSNSLSTGIWIEQGNNSLSLSNVSVNDNGVYGVIMQGSGTMEANGLNISVDPAMTPSYNIDEWPDNGLGSMGLLISAETVNLQDVSITGYNNCGANISTDIADATISVDGLTIDNVGRKGLLLSGYEGLMNNLSVTNIYDLDELHQADPNPETGLMEFCGFVDRNVGARFFSADVDLTNATFDNIEGYGLSIVQANSVIDTLYTANSICAPAVAFQGSMTVDNGEFVGYNNDYDALGASLVGYESTLLQVTNSSFQGIKDEYGISVFARGGDNFFFENNSFKDAAIGIYTYDAGLTLTGNTFTEQSNYSLYLNGNGLRSHVLEDNIFQGQEDLFSTAIQCYSGDSLEMSGDSFTDIYGYYAVSSYNCAMEMEDIHFENTGYYGISSYGGDLELDSVSFTNTGINGPYTHAVYASVSDPTSASIVNSTFDNTNGDAIYLATSNIVTAPFNVILDTISITSSGDDGISLTRVTADMNNITITDPNGSGIYATNASIALHDGSISGAGNDGLSCSSCDLSITNSSLSLNAGAGIYLVDTTTNLSNVSSQNNVGIGLYSNGGDVTIASSAFTANTSFGALLLGSASADANISLTSSDFSNNGQSGLELQYAAVSMDAGISSNNGEYGLECQNTSFSLCAMSNITGNTLGEQTGCDSTCGEEANPNTDTGDTGAGDTGEDTGWTGDTGSGDTGWTGDTGDTGN